MENSGDDIEFAKEQEFEKKNEAQPSEEEIREAM